MTLRTVAETLTATGTTPARAAPFSPIVYAAMGISGTGTATAALHIVDDIGQDFVIATLGNLTGSTTLQAHLPAYMLPAGSHLYWDVEITNTATVILSYSYVG